MMQERTGGVMERRDAAGFAGSKGWRTVVCLLLVVVPLKAAAQTPAASPAAAAAPLRLVSTPWSPFTNAADQARFALDLVEAALGRIGVRAETTIVEPAAFTSSMLSPGFDGSAAAWKDDQREKVLLYSQPYLENRLLLVGRRRSDVSATTLDALAGRKVVVVGGYAYGDAVTASGPQFVQSGSEEESLAQLLAGQADYTLMDELVIQHILRDHGEQARNLLEIGTTPIVVRPLHLAIRRDRPDAASIINRFHGELRRRIADVPPVVARRLDPGRRRRRWPDRTHPRDRPGGLRTAQHRLRPLQGAGASESHGRRVRRERGWRPLLHGRQRL
jgi:ABC-type amino acid transport substrate-binding protein